MVSAIFDTILNSHIPMAELVEESANPKILMGLRIRDKQTGFVFSSVYSPKQRKRAENRVLRMDCNVGEFRYEIVEVWTK